MTPGQIEKIKAEWRDKGMSVKRIHLSRAQAHTLFAACNVRGAIPESGPVGIVSGIGIVVSHAPGPHVVGW